MPLTRQLWDIEFCINHCVMMQVWEEMPENIHRLIRAMPRVFQCIQAGRSHNKLDQPEISFPPISFCMIFYLERVIIHVSNNNAYITDNQR